MTRTALARRTPLRSTKPLQRKTAMRRVRHDRIRALRAKQFAEQAALACTLPCCSCGAPPPSDPSHLRSRGMGGCNGTDSDVVPQCRACHDALGNEGRFSFWLKRGLDPQRILSQMRAAVALMNPRLTRQPQREVQS